MKTPLDLGLIVGCLPSSFLGSNLQLEVPHVEDSLSALEFYLNSVIFAVYEIFDDAAGVGSALVLTLNWNVRLLDFTVNLDCRSARVHVPGSEVADLDDKFGVRMSL